MTICIYHASCADGFGAALVVRQALGEVKFFPTDYQMPPPDVTGEDVLIVDFSYKRPILLEMAQQANSILILDHHKTAMEDLIGLPENVTVKFDMNHSGTILTWNYFFPNQPPPRLLQHIEDRDLWKFALNNTREIMASVHSYEYDFFTWDTLIATDMDVLVAEGKAINRKQMKDVRDLIGVTRRDVIIGGYRIPVANVPFSLSSEVGHQLAKGNPFAACYLDLSDGRAFSLRSTDEGVDVSNIAKLYGGGGHRNASGFKVSFAEAAKFEIG